MALKLWRRRGVEAYLFQMRWEVDEPFDVKLRRLLRLIDRLHDAGRDVGLVGASAGASVVLTAFAARPEAVGHVACICGKIQNGDTVSPYTYRRNPSFRTAMDGLPDILSGLAIERRSKILSLTPQADPAVPPADTKLEGARCESMPIAGHAFGIAYGLIFKRHRIIRWLRQR